MDSDYPVTLRWELQITAEELVERGLDAIIADVKATYFIEPDETELTVIKQ